MRNPTLLRKLLAKLQTVVSNNRKASYLLIGLLVAVSLSPWTEHRYDIYVFRLWPTMIMEYGLYPLGSQLYTSGQQPPHNFPQILGYSYPPIWLGISLPIFSLWQRLTSYSPPIAPSDLWIYGIEANNIAESYRSFVPSSLPLLDFLLKLPNILSLAGISYILLRLARDPRQEKGVLLFWILNPYIIQIVAVWGSFDILATFFAFSSAYALSARRESLSAILLSLGFCTKLYPVLFLIPNMIFVLKRKGVKNSLLYVVTFALVTGVVFGSFVLLFPHGLEFSYSLLIGRASPDMQGTTFISGITWLGFLNLINWHGSLPIFPIIFIPTYFFLIYIFVKGKSDTSSLNTTYTTILFLFYITYTVVNPQYFLWILPFLFYSVLTRATSIRSYIVVSLVPLVWVYIHYSPLYFVSPTLVWEEGNFPPWSQIIAPLRSPIFINWTEALLTAFVSLRVLLLLSGTLRREWRIAKTKPENSQKLS